MENHDPGEICMQMQQQQAEIDRLIAIHARNVKAEMAERGLRLAGQILAAAEESISRQMQAKDEEIERIRKLNFALEERVRGLCVENQAWREVAWSNEAAIVVLRSNLEQVFAAQAVEEGCGESEEVERRVCRNCGEREAVVLLMPCRHLCACSACAPLVGACPVCKCAKGGSVVVHLC